MSISDKVRQTVVLSIVLLSSTSLNADEKPSSKTNVLNQIPYSSNQFPENTIVVESERHGKGTFTSYPSNYQNHRPIKSTRNRNVYHRRSPSRIYSSPQPNISYYYATPIVNGGYVQIESNHGIYNNREQSPRYRTSSPHINYAHGAKAVNRHKIYQQYRSYPYRQQAYPAYHTHNTNPQPRPQCLGPNCGK